jgi:hypothetical protein
LVYYTQGHFRLVEELVGKAQLAIKALAMKRRVRKKFIRNSMCMNEAIELTKDMISSGEV